MQRTIGRLIVVALLATACTTEGGAEGSLPGGDETASPNPPGTEASLVRVIDGDSVQVDVGGEAVEVRLIGVNAPELDECHGDLARDALDAALNGEAIVVEAGGAGEVDQFGRSLRYVWAGGIDVNAAMLAAGHALAVQSGHDREAEYVDLAEAAARDGRGLWARTACGSAGTATVDIVGIEYDPPGRDAENQLNEWVELRNAGPEALQLGGWTLRDESTRHRYRFGDVVLGPGETVRIRTGCGEDRGTDLVWCAGDAVWSNGGDTVILQDEFGAVVVHQRYAGGY